VVRRRTVSTTAITAKRENRTAATRRISRIGSLSASFLPRNTASAETTSSAAQDPMNTETGSE
jgi:hypothetical protein